MERDTEQQEQLVDLGSASANTLGGGGQYFDLVGMMRHWGISND
jgi:hypothetical protein